ncbi:MAG: DUF2628 domain-containing protein [Pseudomonadota bacterium]
MARTRVFTVHHRPGGPEAWREAVFVKEGFCWPAALLSLLWALHQRLWFAALGIAASAIGLALMADAAGLDAASEATLGFAWALLIGYEANDWRRRALNRRGFLEAGVVAAPDLAEAERRFFARPPARPAMDAAR